MNLFKPSAGFRPSATAAFTLPEMLIAISIFLLLVAGITTTNLFGMRWFQMTQTKLLATDSARVAIGKMTDEIRGCDSSYVGDVSTNGIFAGRTNGEFQIGSSLLIYPTTNTTNFILYFRNASDQSFRRTCAASGLTTVVAKTVTNTDIFQVQDYLGNVLTNNQNSRVVRCTLKYYQTAPNTPVPDSYTLDMAVSRRAL